MILIFAAFLLLSLATAARAEGTPVLSFPVDCEIGKTCYIQHYVDHIAGRGYLDYRCGPLSEEGHDGTDIALNDVAAMERGFRVTAAAAGTVIETRNDMPDVNVQLVGRNAVTDRGLGNVVIIDHGDGWLTTYGHLRRGTVAVKRGQHVERGQVLGEIGMSGLSAFPHVHFSVWHHRVTVDPFVGEGEREDCSAGSSPLWAPDVLARLPYVPTFIMHSGFATRPMAKIALEYGLYDHTPLPRSQGRLFFGVFAAGLYPNDKYVFTLKGPDGQTLKQDTGRLSLLRAVQFFELAYKSNKPLPAGRYEARFTLSGTRDKRSGTVLDRSGSVTLK